MTKLLSALSALVIFALSACGSQQPAQAQTQSKTATGTTTTVPPTTGFAPKDLTGLAQATFAGGCFWAQEEAFEQIKGVRQVVSGYAGGTVPNPSYEQVCGQRTGHTESVNVYYDPQTVSYATLVDVFFRASHDPTTLNRQGPDSGPEYRSAIFYRTPEEKQTVDAAVARVNAAKLYDAKIVTQVAPLTQFWPAEDYHQGYFRLHPDQPYVASVSARKVAHVRQVFPQLIKADVPALVNE